MTRSCMRSASLLALLLTQAGPTFGGVAQDQTFPAGSDKAVRAVREIFADAVLSKVSEPKGFGASTTDGSALFWVVDLKRNGTEQQLKVTPDGVIILLPQPVAEQDVPKAISDAMTKEAAGGRFLHCEKQEARATLRYAALAKPIVHYVAHIAKDGQLKRLDMAADGKVLFSQGLGAEPESGAESAEESEEEPGEKSESKEATAPRAADVPPDAAKAVAAVRAILPNMVFKCVEEVGYLDGTGDMDVLNYEVEFYLDGKERVWNATPDGIVMEVPTEIAAAALPAPVRETLTKEAGWETKRLVKEETRAGLKFVPLEKPKVVYQLEVEQGGKPVKIRFRADGTKIQEIDPKALLGKKP